MNDLIWWLQGWVISTLRVYRLLQDILFSLVILDNFRVSDNNALLKSICYYIALPLDSLLLRGVAARSCFWLRAQCHKHARCHARPLDSLKAVMD